MPEITREQLAAALDHQWVYAENRDGAHHAQVCITDDMVCELWEKLVGQRPESGSAIQDDRAEHLERAIKDGLIGPEGFVVPAITAGKVLGVVMGALALYEGNRQRQATAAADPELTAMAEIVRLMEAGTLDGHAVVRALYPLDGRALVRVLRWLLARFPEGED